MTNVKVLVLRTAGTNCNEETVFAFKSCGAIVDQVHINKLVAKEVSLHDYHIFALPGGFSYGDDIAAGRILANELRLHLGEDLRKFIQDGKLAIGICNGFQIMVKAGILPGPVKATKEAAQEVTLMHNDSGRFEDRWIHLKTEGKSVWTKGMDQVVYLPVAHGEGKFLPKDKTILRRLSDNGQVAFRYCDADGKSCGYPQNPNGSLESIAGITDETGRVLGLMPHPERHFLFVQHPSWTRLDQKAERGQGAKIFENGVNYVKENLL